MALGEICHLMSEWRVRLRGNKSDLVQLATLFRSPNLTVVLEGDNYYLTSADFKSLKDARSVLSRGRELAREATGAAAMELGLELQPVQLAGVTRVEEGRPQTQFLLPSSIVDRGKGPPLASALASGEPWVDAAVRKACRFFGSGENWFNFYKAYEAIEEGVGGMNAILQKGWATKNQIRNFKHTANSEAAIGDEARHGRERSTPPPHPMSLQDAKSFIRGLFENLAHFKMSVD